MDNKEKKTALDIFLEDQIKNATLYEGYTIQELSEKMDSYDNRCPTCGKSFSHEQPHKSKLYRLKKKDEIKKSR